MSALNNVDHVDHVACSAPGPHRAFAIAGHPIGTPSIRARRPNLPVLFENQPQRHVFNTDILLSEKPGLLSRSSRYPIPRHSLLILALGLCSCLAPALRAFPASSHLYWPLPFSKAQFKSCLESPLACHPTHGFSEVPSSDSRQEPLASSRDRDVTFHVCHLCPQMEPEQLRLF